MTRQKRVSKLTQRSERNQESQATHGEDAASKRRREQQEEYAQAVAHDLDKVLDEIDSVLEQNAEEFVKGYVQKGGQ